MLLENAHAEISQNYLNSFTNPISHLIKIKITPSSLKIKGAYSSTTLLLKSRVVMNLKLSEKNGITDEVWRPKSQRNTKSKG